MIVVDTNVISYFFIHGPFAKLAREAAQHDTWCAPPLWRSEFRNVLALYVRRRSMRQEDALSLMNLAEIHFWGREFSVQSSEVLELAGRSKSSAYDCEFVALARQLGVKLITADNPLIAQFPNDAIHLRDYIALSRRTG